MAGLILPMMATADFLSRNLKPKSISRFFQPCTTLGFRFLSRAVTNSLATSGTEDNTNFGKSLACPPACAWKSELVAPGLKPITRTPLLLNSYHKDSEKLATKLLVPA